MTTKRMRGRPALPRADTPAGRLGTAIRRERLKRGLTAAEAGAKAGLSANRWWELERGGSDTEGLFSRLVAVAGALELKPERLLRELAVTVSPTEQNYEAEPPGVNVWAASFGNANLLYNRNTTAVASMMPPKTIHIKSGRCASRANLPYS